MNTHQNARLTLWGREELVRRVVQDQEPVAVVAAALHVSTSTVYKWVRRFAEEGVAGLVDRSSRPHQSPRCTAPTVVRRILQLRRQRLTGPEIAEQLGVPPSTVGRVLQRLGMGRLRQPVAERGGKAYQRAVPGDLLHVDTKALPRFLAVGHRIHGNRSKVGRRHGLGADHLHVAIDDATRIAFAELHPTAQASACAAFLANAQHWFASLGIAVRAVMTDNARAYRPALRTLPGVRHLTTRPYHPQTNGKAERFIQTALRRWAYKRPYRTSTHRNAALPDFLETYNFERPHRAIGRIPPVLSYLMRREQRA